MCACRCECYVQGFFRMDFAVNILGKSHYNMWASVCLHTATARPSLKTSPHVPFQFVATVYQRFSHLFLLLTDILDNASPHTSACNDARHDVICYPAHATACSMSAHGGQCFLQNCLEAVAKRTSWGAGVFYSNLVCCRRQVGAQRTRDSSEELLF